MSGNAIAVLVGELLAAGIDVAAIMAEARAEGRVSDETWAEIRGELDRANQRWDAAGK